MSYQGGILLDAGTNELEVVEFHLNTPNSGGQTKVGYYGINVAKVKEIVMVPEMLTIPMTHPAVAGAINLRGQVITLINLAKWLGLPSAVTKKSRVIVTEFNGVVNGFIVDAITRIHRLSWEQVVPPPSDIALSLGDCLTSVVKLDDRILLMLDFEAIIADINPAIRLKGEAAATASDLARGDKQVWVVEDSSSIRRIIVGTLTDAGYQVKAAENGEVAWNMLESGAQNGSLPDLLISDIEMPKMDGMHLLSRLKSTPVLQALPVIMFSSLGSDSNRDKALKLGALDLIRKPDLPQLVNMVDDILFAEQPTPAGV
jgi:two-component system chemotaxis response regulator CheV